MFNNLSHQVSEDDISRVVSKLANLLTEEMDLDLLREMKSRLKQIPATFTSHVGTWVDNDGLDLLHYSIINNCPDMVEFLLMEPKWFPPTQFPQKNPYAHLAALFGFVDCLRLVLQYRPTDYFSGSRPSHVIRLPANIRKKLKSIDSIRSVANKHIEKLLLKLKSSSDAAENEMHRPKDTIDEMNEVDIAFTNELQVLEKSNKKIYLTSKIHRSLSLATKSTNETKRISATHEENATTQTLQSNSITTMVNVSRLDNKGSRQYILGKNLDKTKELNLKKCQQQAFCDKKHLITVHWDFFSAAPKGVIQGAGKKVNVNYTENAHLERTLDITEMKHKMSLGNKAGWDELVSLKNIDMQKLSKQRLTTRIASPINTPKLPKVLEPGIRGRKKYKDFYLNREDIVPGVMEHIDGLTDKTPLTLAAQYGYLDCVQMILELVILKKHPSVVVKEPLTMATKAKSPDAILLIMDHKVNRTDYQSAVLIAIRDMYPDCLTALLTPTKNKERQSLFDGINLFHILYTQSLLSDNRYEMLPTMTTALINSNEDVNAHSVYSTFPMYTLINCAFNITIGKRIFYYIECLKILLENKANPHFDEIKSGKPNSVQTFSRNAYSSAINCIFDSAANSVNYFESTHWSKIFMKKILTTLTVSDRTSRRVLSDALFNYMNTVCSLGIDKYIVRCLLRYGANADSRNEGKYAINIYFDKLFPYLVKFDINNTYSKWQQELNALMLVCHDMSYTCLKEAELIFLNEHLLNCPIQALPLCRSFAHYINETLRSPRPLTDLITQYIWQRLRRNEKVVKTLLVPDEFIWLILP